MERIEFIIPSYYLSYYINGDDSGYSEEDLNEMDRFSDKVAEECGNSCFIYEGGESWFSWRNDVNSLGADVCEVVILTDKK